MTNKHGPTKWGGRFAYFLLLVVKPVFLLIGVVAGSNILAVTGVALILLALAVALTLEGRAHGTWQETHFDFLVRSIGVWTALAFNWNDAHGRPDTYCRNVRHRRGRDRCGIIGGVAQI